MQTSYKGIKERIGPGETQLVSGSGKGKCPYPGCNKTVKSTECGWIWHAHDGYWIDPVKVK
jgi:hypothetical protein